MSRPNIQTNQSAADGIARLLGDARKSAEWRPGSVGPAAVEGEAIRSPRKRSGTSPTQRTLVADGEPLTEAKRKRRAYSVASLPPGFVAECPVVAGRKFRFDYAWPRQMIALEIEGGFFGKGKPCPTCGRRSVAGHGSIQRIKTDMTKYNLAAAYGWRVFRCLPQQFKSGEAASMIAKVLENLVG